MDPVVGLLLKNGAFGLLAGVGFYLYLHERKANSDYAAKYLEHQVADTAAKTKLAVTLEDLAETVEALGVNASSDIAGCKEVCGNMIVQMREQRAKEDGRREITGRYRLPVGGDDEK